MKRRVLKAVARVLNLSRLRTREWLITHGFAHIDGFTPCPFCGGLVVSVHVITGARSIGHRGPTCEMFDGLSADDFMRAVRDHTEGKGLRA